MNHAKSYLEFDFQLPALAAVAGQTITTDIATLGVPHLARLSLYTRGGVQLAEIQDCSRYLATVLPYTTSRKDLLDTDPARFETDIVFPTEPLHPITPAGVFTATNVVDAAPFAGHTQACNLIPTINAAIGFVNESIYDVAQMSRLVGVNAAAQNSMQAHYRIPLSTL